MQSTTKKGKVNTARPAVHCSNPLIGIEPDPPIQKVRVTHTKEKTHTTPKKTGETFSHLFSSSSCPFLGLYHSPPAGIEKARKNWEGGVGAKAETLRK